jgi:protein disulfide-isomerase
VKFFVGYQLIGQYFKLFSLIFAIGLCMRFRLLFFVLVGSLAFSLPLTGDFNRALHTAKAYQKPMAVVFTGSEWNPESKRLEDAILASEEFAKEMGNECILVHLDYSNTAPLSANVLVLNHCVKEEYHVETFPTVVLVDSDGMEICRTGFFPIDGREYALHLKTKLSEYDALCNADHGDIASLYFRAKKLGCGRLVHEFLELGLEKTRDPRLLMEEYARLAKKGDQETPHGIAVRLDLLSAKIPDLLSRMAILDYQIAGNIAPLEAHCKTLKRNDANLWQIELLIAEHYTKAGMLQKALAHARSASENAPIASKVAIMETVKEIEKTN